MLDDLNKIHNHFGHDNQRVKLLEECEEFIESRSDEEIADLYVVVVQLVENDEYLKQLVEYKISRTLQRIESGYYETR